MSEAHEVMSGREYRQAQIAIAELKAAIISLLEGHTNGLSNASIGRSLGIYGGHKGHEGHISRTLLAMLGAEGLVEQNPENQRWSMRSH